MMKRSTSVQKFFPCFDECQEVIKNQFLFCDSNCQDQADILMLHGGGIVSGLHHYNELREDLHHLGISSCAFDFIGHGRSGGILSDSSLAQRTEEAYEVAVSGRLRHPLTLVGASMGAYTALKMTEHCQVDALILIVPAVYARHAYEARFQGEFTKIIRQPMSWLGSDAWEIAERFTGSLAIIAAENDEVVPQEIPLRLFKAAKNAKGRYFHTVPNSPHKILTFLQDAESERTIVADIIARCHQHDL